MNGKASRKETSRHRCVYNIKIEGRAVWAGLIWLGIGSYSNVPSDFIKNVYKFLTSTTTGGISRRADVHVVTYLKNVGKNG